MVWISASDRQNILFLSEGYLPDLKSLNAASPRSPRYYRQTRPEFTSRQTGMAWTLTAFAHRVAWYRRVARRVGALPLETWLLTRSENHSSQLATWFDEIPGKAAYGLMIHRQPRRHLNQELRFCPWKIAYRSLSIRHRSGSYVHLKQSGEDLLRAMLTAYGNEREEVATVLAETAHPFYFSDGLLNPSNSSLDVGSADRRSQM